jgi:uncharacterized protein (DUF488 family)
MELLTIGYEGRSLDEYLALLREAGATVLCDVRRNPLSRKRGFSKRSLAAACAGAGIRYEHLPELGIASERRKAVVTKADVDALFAEYRRELPEQAAAVDRVRVLVRAGERVALTCFERSPADCHRHVLAETLAADPAIVVRDL